MNKTVIKPESIPNIIFKIPNMFLIKGLFKTNLKTEDECFIVQLTFIQRNRKLEHGNTLKHLMTIFI